MRFKIDENGCLEVIDFQLTQRPLALLLALEQRSPEDRDMSMPAQGDMILSRTRSY